MGWTDERVELLKKMWNEGQSASVIAKELGNVTRNAVIGKVHRLGLSNRAGAAEAETGSPVETPGVTPGAAPASDAAPVPEGDGAAVGAASDPDAATPEAPPPPRQNAHLRRQIIPAGQPLPPQPSANEISPEALAKVNEIEKKSRKIDLMDLTERTCKWPVGDPATEDFWFCGLPSQQGKPYCEAHVGVAFQPMSSRRDRRR